MWEKLNARLARFFADAELNKLFAVGLFILLALWLFAAELAPLLAGILIAYILESAVQRMLRMGIKRSIAAAFAVSAAAGLVIAAFYALPRQMQGLSGDLPKLQESGAQMLAAINLLLPREWIITDRELAIKAGALAGEFGQYLLENTVAVARDVFSTFVYLVVIPLFVFFLLKDKNLLMAAVQRHLPSSVIFGDLWRRVDEQFGAYLRGKSMEAGIVGAVSLAAFLILGVDYALALSVMIGLSVFVPFVGAVAVTVPVVALGFLQFGWSVDFAQMMGVYTIIQLLDGQVLVPLLFSGVVRLHPVTIFAAIIFFGNLWGFLGVFFAIPLASLIKSVVAVMDARRAL
ncbi:MAG: AI-2E family transporter [Gammaproteobacteria bacterium]